MKKTFIILILFSLHYFNGQKYISLDDFKTKFRVEQYTLETKKLYNINKHISVYNVFIDNNIILFSVLPPYEPRTNNIIYADYEKLKKNIPSSSIESSIQEDINWERINIETIKENIVSISSVLDDFTAEWGWDITPEKKTFKYKLVKKIGDNYYASNTCLTELFLIKSSKYPLITPYGTINILEPKVTIKQMYDAYTLQFPKDKFPLDVWERSRARGNDGAYVARNYLSKEFKIKNYQAYQLWTFDVWWSMHGDNRHRGIDRFVYIPKKGIVGGSYDFYFRYSDGFHVPDTILWKNILEENVMIAEELK